MEYNSGGGGGSGRNLPNPLGGPGNPLPGWDSGQYARGGNGGGGPQPAGNGTSTHSPALQGNGGGTGQPGIVFMRYKSK